jgi:S-formylglutathione hydrolase FrmB
MQFIEQKWEVTPPKVGVFGTSMGGQGALRLAYKYPDVFPVTAAISPAIDYQIRYREGDEIIRAMYADEEDVRQDTATLHIHPLNWPRHQFFCCDPNDLRWIESVERLQMKLYSLGVPHQYDVETAAGGHGFDYYNDMAPRVMEFLFNALEQERRRIV